MMRLDRYIGATVLGATLLAWLVVSVLDALFVLLGQLGDIGRGDYGLTDALLYVLLGLPTRAWQAFPMAALIGVLLGLGNLAEQRELDAFRLAGCSTRRLVLAVVQAGALLLVALLLLGEGLAPRAQHLAQQLRSEAIFAGVGVQRDAGFWVRDGQRFIQVGRSESDGDLGGLVVYELAQGARLAQVTAAARARPRDGQWRLEDVSVTQFHADHIAVTREPRADWPALLEPRLARLLTRNPETLSLSELGEYIDYLRRNGSDVGIWRLNFWQRLAAPLETLAMLLLAAALVLGALGRRPLGQRLLVAVFAGLLFKLLAGVIAHAGLVYGLNAAASALLPAVAVLLAAAGLLRRPH
jgi:lipopolysaccharide export system permease protein